MKKIVLGIITVIIFCFTSEANAQVIKGKFISQGLSGKEIKLFRTEGNYKYVIDSTNVKEDNSFTFSNKNYPKGYYKISLGNEKNIIDVILNPKESIVNLEFTQFRLEKGVNVLVSDENIAYWKYKKKELQIEKKIKGLSKQRRQYKSQENDTKVNELTNEIEKLSTDLYDYTVSIVDQYKNTFFAYTMKVSNTSETREKGTYFDDIDFSDESLIRSYALATRITNYIVKHSGHTEVGYYNAVDVIMDKAKENEKVFEFSLYNLLDGFYSSGLEDVATYIMEEYFYGDACGEIEVNDLLKQKAQLIKNLQIGNTPPDFNIESYYGGEINLNNTCANNKYTAVIFWASHCGHCMRELPGFVKNYNQYKPKGFEVIGIALDVNRNTWKKTIQDNNFNWINVSQFQNYQSPVCKDYKINKTPSIFVLNSKMEIVEKCKETKVLLDFLKQNM